MRLGELLSHDVIDGGSAICSCWYIYSVCGIWNEHQWICCRLFAFRKAIKTEFYEIHNYIQNYWGFKDDGTISLSKGKRVFLYSIIHLSRNPQILFIFRGLQVVVCCSVIGEVPYLR